MPDEHAPLSTALHTLKGAPLSVLCALIAIQRPAGASLLSELTGYSDKPVSKALRKLERHGYAQAHGRYNAWLATGYAKQLLLPENPAQLLEGQPVLGFETEKLRLPPSSSSSSPNSPPDTEQLPQPDSETAILRLPGPWRDTLLILNRKCSIPRDRALDVTLTARTRNEYPGQTAYNALMWLSYTRTPDAETINNPAWFVAARVEDGTPPPTDYRPPNDCPLWAHILGARQQWNKQLLDEYGDNDLPY